MDLIEKYLGEGYYRKGGNKKAQQQKWNAEMLDNVKKVLPKIEAPTPQDFWPTMTTLFNQGKSAKDAAKRAIELYGKSK